MSDSRYVSSNDNRRNRQSLRSVSPDSSDNLPADEFATNKVDIARRAGPSTGIIVTVTVAALAVAATVVLVVVVLCDATTAGTSTSDAPGPLSLLLDAQGNARNQQPRLSQQLRSLLSTVHGVPESALLAAASASYAPLAFDAVYEVYTVVMEMSNAAHASSPVRTAVPCVFDTGSVYLLVGMESAYVYQPPPPGVLLAAWPDTQGVVSYRPAAGAPGTAVLQYASQHVVASVVTDMVRVGGTGAGFVSYVVHNRQTSSGSTQLNVAGFSQCQRLAADDNPGALVECLLSSPTLASDDAPCWGFLLLPGGGMLTFGSILHAVPGFPAARLQLPPGWPLAAKLYSCRVCGVRHRSSRLVETPTHPLWVVFDTGFRRSYACAAARRLMQGSQGIVLDGGVTLDFRAPWPESSGVPAMDSFKWASNIILIGADLLRNVFIEFNLRSNTLRLQSF